MTKYILTPTGRKLLTEEPSFPKTTFDVGDDVETEFGHGKVTEIKDGEKPFIKVNHYYIFPDQRPEDPDFKNPIEVLSVKHRRK